ncbi:MAG: hypothetical protein O3C34_01200 [Proteobacteria bacterium]|nr:hypothetical protein [Pseudomonadota bacterium]
MFLIVRITCEGIGPKQNRENQKGGKQRSQRYRRNLTMPNREIHSIDLIQKDQKSFD